MTSPSRALLVVILPFLIAAEGVRCAAAGADGGLGAAAERVDQLMGGQSNHTNNWAVLVCTSRFWFNYRHMANTLSMYHTVKRLGIPDSQIILMLADDMACSSRNSFPSAVFNNKRKGLNLYGSHVEVDYRGYAVTVENLIRVLTGRHDPAVPLSKRLRTDSSSNVLVFLTGHGGAEFLKFQDDEELGAQDLADALRQMHNKGRYRELLLIFETCEASTMWRRVESPGVLGMASSKLGEKSYSHHASAELGVSVIDRFTFYFMQFMERHVPGIHSRASLQDLYESISAQPLHSTAAIMRESDSHAMRRAPVVDFFGSIKDARPLLKVHPVQERSNSGRDDENSARPNWVATCVEEASTEGSHLIGHQHDGLRGLWLLLTVFSGFALCCGLCVQPNLDNL